PNTAIYTLSLHDALPIFGAQINNSGTGRPMSQPATRTGLRPTRSDSVPAKKFVIALTTPNAAMNVRVAVKAVRWKVRVARSGKRSEEHTSELQSLAYLVC